MSASEPSQQPSQAQPPVPATVAGTTALVNGFTLQVSAVLEAWFGNVVAQVLAHRFVTPTIQSIEALVLDALTPIRKRFVAVFEAMWSEGHNRGRTHTIGTYGLDVDAGRLDAEIEQALRENGQRAAELVEHRIAGDLADALVEAYRAGLSVEEMADVLRDDVIPDMLGWQAERVAQTEVRSAVNKGTLTALTEANVPGKRWAAIDDSRTRQSHRHTDGQTRLIGRPFSVGGFHAEYPGDMSLPAQERVNCRCGVVPVFDIADL